MMPDLWGPPSAAEISAAENENARLSKRVKELEAQNAELSGKIGQLESQNRCFKENKESCEKRMIDLAQRVPRWISVEERLPEDYEDVVIIMRDGASSWYRVAYREYGGWSFGGGRRVNDEVTHWMPLPELPKEE